MTHDPEILVAQSKWENYFSGQDAPKHTVDLLTQGYHRAYEKADSRVTTGQTQTAWGNPKAARKAAIRFINRNKWAAADIQIVHAGNYKYEPWVKKLLP